MSTDGLLFDLQELLTETRQSDPTVDLGVDFRLVTAPQMALPRALVHRLPRDLIERSDEVTAFLKHLQ
jgi:hypothetical protein